VFECDAGGKELSDPVGEEDGVWISQQETLSDGILFHLGGLNLMPKSLKNSASRPHEFRKSQNLGYA